MLDRLEPGVLPVAPLGQRILNLYTATKKNVSAKTRWCPGAVGNVFGENMNYMTNICVSYVCCSFG